MQHIRSFTISHQTAGDASAPLLDSGKGDWAVHTRTLGAGVNLPARPDVDRFFLVLDGESMAAIDGISIPMPPKAMLFLPCGATALIEGVPAASVLEVTASSGAAAQQRGRKARVVPFDERRFEGSGFAYQSLIDRATGSPDMRINLVRVEPGSGSPDFHIHAFDQVYIILEGEMQVDIGTHRYTASANSIVYLPAGMVHRNYNAGPGVETHFSLLVPEPAAGEILDYAVTVHPREAEILTRTPAPLDLTPG